uniref:Uncharacterized protein n=1 Tax=Trichogramma kaykai TaxID=54128 RepID=A0ABD2WDS3_9HYME
MKKVESAKYLSVIFDCYMRWSGYVDRIINRTKYLLYVFYRLQHILSRRRLLQIYYGLFHSVATYGIIGWGGVYETALRTLQGLQARIMRIIQINDSDPVKPPNLRQAFVTKAIVKQYHQHSYEYINKQVNTRFKSLTLPRQRLTIGQRSYVYQAAKFFNLLPNSLKNLKSNSVVKNRCQCIGK